MNDLNFKNFLILNFDCDRNQLAYSIIIERKPEKNRRSGEDRRSGNDRRNGIGNRRDNKIKGKRSND